MQDMFGFYTVLAISTDRILELRGELTRQWVSEGEPKSGRLHDLLSVLTELYWRRTTDHQLANKLDWRIETPSK